jgi:hypothetical protein
MAKKKKCATKFCRRLTEAKHCSTCRSRKARQADQIKYAFITLRNNAKRRGIPFTLTLEDFKTFCVKTKYIAGKGRSSMSYTIDRIYNNIGYHVDNIQVLTKGDNVRKMHLNYDWEHKVATIYKTKAIMGGG